MKMTRLRYLLVVSLIVLGVVLFHKRAESALAGRLAELKKSAGDVHYAKLVPAGEAIEGGIYDPCVAYTPDGSVGWLVYTSVKGDYKPVGPYTETHLARSTNGGASWEFVKALNHSTNSSLMLPDGNSLAGVWRYEVPTLVHDPTDPDPDNRWKLFTHYYFWSPQRDRMVNYGCIVMNTAANPAREWSADVPLFGAGKSPQVPCHKTLVDINALEPALHGSVAYSEPGVLAREGRLYLSLTALQPHLGLGGVGVSHTIFLLASDDHGKRWRFVRLLLTPEDAKSMGCEFFDGSSLAEDAGRFFLLASPVVRQGREEVHEGTVALEFESLANGRLRSARNHQLEIANYFAPQSAIFSGGGAGQATYDSRNIHGGLIMPQFNLLAYPEVFQIFQTSRRLMPDSRDPAQPGGQ